MANPAPKTAIYCKVRTVLVHSVAASDLFKPGRILDATSNQRKKKRSNGFTHIFDVEFRGIFIVVYSCDKWMWISIRSQQLGNPNPNPKQQTPSQLGRAKAEFHQLWGSAEFLLQRRYHVSVDARRCGGFPRVIDEKGASNWSYLVGEPGVKIHKWQEWRNTRNKNTHVICQFSLAADFVFFIFCQDLSQRCWLVAPTNRRSGWFTNARHAGDRGWNLKDLLRARVLSVALWVPDGCEDPLVFVNEPPPCQKNSCDSASPWFFCMSWNHHWYQPNWYS